MNGLSVFRRGELARRSGLGIETLRYYEKVGLIPQPPRSSGGYREYPGETLQRLRFIQSSKQLGFSLGEIRGLLQLKDQRDTSCEKVRERALQKLVEVESKIEELERIREDLRELVELCDGSGAPEDCAIVTSLEEQQRS